MELCTRSKTVIAMASDGGKRIKRRKHSNSGGIAAGGELRLRKLPDGNSHDDLKWIPTPFRKLFAFELIGIRAWLLLVHIAAAVAAVSSLWAARFLPFQDYPSHLLREHALAHLRDPSSPYAVWFRSNWGIIPNQLSDATIVLLMRASGISVELASKLVLALTCAAIPFAGLWMVRRLRPPDGAAMEFTFLHALLVMNFFLLSGNVNFYVSIPLFLLFVGTWFGGDEETAGRRRARAVAIWALAIMLYYCHMVTFGAALVLAVAWAIATRDARPKKRLLRLAPFLPGLVLTLVYLIRLRFAKSDTQVALFWWFSDAAQWRIALEQGIAPFPFGLNREGPAALVYFALIAFLAAGTAAAIVAEFRRRKFHSQDLQPGGRQRISMLAGILILIAAGLALPEWFGVFRPGQRFAYLALMLLPIATPTHWLFRTAFCCAALPLLVVTRLWEREHIRAHGAEVAQVVSTFEQVKLPSGWNGKVLAVQTSASAFSTSLHRSAEYFHILHGGVSPYHLIGPDHTAAYKSGKPPHPDIYLGQDASEAMFRNYNLLIVPGAGFCADGDLFVQERKQRGWRALVENEAVAVLARIQKPRQHTPVRVGS